MIKIKLLSWIDLKSKHYISHTPPASHLQPSHAVRSVAGLQWSRSQYCARQPVYVTVTARDRVTNCKQLKQLKQLETD